MFVVQHMSYDGEGVLCACGVMRRAFASREEAVAWLETSLIMGEPCEQIEDEYWYAPDNWNMSADGRVLEGEVFMIFECVVGEEAPMSAGVEPTYEELVEAGIEVMPLGGKETE